MSKLNLESKFERFISNTFANVGQSFYDSYVEANVKFRSRAGSKTYIIRRQIGSCCKWCASLAGIYESSDAPDDIYRRHQNCKCLVTFKNEKGYTDVWSKKEFEAQKEARIQKIKEIELENKNKQTVNISAVNSKSLNKLERKLNQNWASLQDCVKNSKDNVDKFRNKKTEKNNTESFIKTNVLKKLNELGFDDNYYVAKISSSLINEGGQTNIILSKENLAYILSRHCDQFPSSKVFLDMADVLKNYDMVLKGKYNEEGDLKFFKTYKSKDSIYGYELFLRKKSSDEYIVHFMRTGKKSTKKIYERYTKSNLLIDKRR